MFMPVKIPPAKTPDNEEYGKLRVDNKSDGVFGMLFALYIDAKDGKISMNNPSNMSHSDILRISLRQKLCAHRDLDAAIHALAHSRTADSLTLQRLKKQKLTLKDTIARIEDALTPDIIA